MPDNASHCSFTESACLYLSHFLSKELAPETKHKENGPTLCGDEWADPVIMKHLECELIQTPGNIFKQYQCDHPPRVVLDRLDALGYKVVSTCGAGQTIIWTMHKP